MKNIIHALEIAFVFIGTVVGAGLASGQEILQFFTMYGFNGTIGIVLCGILYIVTGIITMEVSYKYNAASYRDLIYLSCGKYIGFVIDNLTTFFMFGGICIILAGSGSIFKEYLGLPHIIGILVMAAVTAFVVFYSTEGLVFINSIIVPCMLVVITIISIMVFTGRTASYSVVYDIVHAPAIRDNWLWSSLLYTSFNMLAATGVLAPMTRDIKKSSGVFTGVVIGAVGLMVLTFVINIVLILNEPNIFRYSIPMLYTARNFGMLMGSVLSVIIWLEMFSTEVANVYSIAKKMYHNFKINYKLSVVLILIIAFPFTKFGFENLIKILYPAYGVISLVYMICLIRLYYKGLLGKITK